MQESKKETNTQSYSLSDDLKKIKETADRLRFEDELIQAISINLPTNAITENWPNPYHMYRVYKNGTALHVIRSPKAGWDHYFIRKVNEYEKVYLHLSTHKLRIEDWLCTSLFITKISASAGSSAKPAAK